jgi:hypothetical protein
MRWRRRRRLYHKMWNWVYMVSWERTTTDMDLRSPFVASALASSRYMEMKDLPSGISVHFWDLFVNISEF